MTETPSDQGDLARRAAEVIAERSGIAEHDVAIVLGSGWRPAVTALGTPTAVLAQAELPGFSPPTAVGHTGELLSMQIGAHRVLVLVGRIHAYEGHDLCHVVHSVRAACAAGVRASPVTAIARILLARMCGLKEARLEMPMSVTPPKRSCTSGPPPL